MLAGFIRVRVIPRIVGLGTQGHMSSSSILLPNMILHVTLTASLRGFGTTVVDEEARKTQNFSLYISKYMYTGRKYRACIIAVVNQCWNEISDRREMYRIALEMIGAN